MIYWKVDTEVAGRSSIQSLHSVKKRLSLILLRSMHLLGVYSRIFYSTAS